MKWFREKLRKNRVIILTVLAVNIFYMVEGTRFVYAYQVYEQKEARLKEISDFLDVPVERLRPDHQSLFDSIKKLFADEVDPVKAAGLKHLQEVLRKHGEQIASNPYLPQIEEVKREHAVYRIEGVIQDLMQLTQPRKGKVLPEASQRALLRNLHHALQDDLTLPLPEGLAAKAQAKHAEMQAKLDRLFASVRPVVAETQGEMMKGTLAQKIARLSAILLP
ncbi:MAG: hypothetical protein GY856_48125 [bacterium]|nr:hypothetical protein [bacterium]